MDALNSALVRMESVAKVFRTGSAEAHPLRDLDPETQRGEYLAIAGPSGCGKPTLLSILGLLDAPSGGQYYPGDRPVASLGPDDRAGVKGREIDFVFQSLNLIGDLTAFKSVELPLTCRDIPERSCMGGPGARGNGGSRDARPVPALGRTPTASSGCAGHHRGSTSGTRGRADRELGFGQRRSGDGTAGRPARGG